MKPSLEMSDLHFEDDGRVWVRKYLGTNRVTKEVMRPYRSLRPGDYTDARDALRILNGWWSLQLPAGRQGAGLGIVDMLYRYIGSSERGWKAGGKTAADYRGKVRCYVEPYWGSSRTSDIEPWVVEDLYDALLARGGRDGGPISANTVRMLHMILSGAFKWAVPRGLAAADPMPYVTPPASVHHEAVSLDEDEVALLVPALLDAQADASLARSNIVRRNALFGAYLALLGGYRCGEVCAESRRDMRIRDGLLVTHVGHNIVESGGLNRVAAPKSVTSRRNLTFSANVCRQLAAHYAWQSGYLGTSVRRREVPVLAGPDGGWMRPSRVSAEFSALRDELGLPPEATFHSLRHTFATWQLEQGTPVHEVSAMLGHASEAITLRIYAHVMPGRAEAYSAAYEGALMKAGGVDGR